MVAVNVRVAGFLGLLVASNACATVPRMSESGSGPEAPSLAETTAHGPCAAPPPPLSVRTSAPLSEADLEEIRTLLAATKSAPIVEIADSKEGRLRVDQWGGYDTCLGSGRGATFEVARIKGRWTIVARYTTLLD